MDARLLPHLIDRIKTAAGCDVLETAKPQDGRIKMEIGGEPYDFRLCFVPLGRGPSVTMRILSSRQGLINLDRIGFAPSDRERIDKALSSPHGVILFTGPTGSGKSTCCYSALARMARPEIKVMSIEDPIEATIPWIDQVQVNASVGLTFARALRSVLRSDLDAVLVGEIRDLETLQLIIQTALTGHLVLSTLHTNRAAELLGEYRLDMFPAAAHPTDEMFYAAHIHIGTIHDEVAGIHLENQLMKYAPAFGALAANSPFSRFRIGGCKSYRMQFLARGCSRPSSVRDPECSQSAWGGDAAPKVYLAPTMEVRIID